MNSSGRKRSWLRLCVLGYVLLLAAIGVAMIWLRQTALSQSVADWQAWRNDVQTQQGVAGPVQRSVPKSEEPPALVLLRDHFGVMVAGAVLFSSLLYWVTAWFVTGALQSKSV
jgi:hypothetical protein